MTFDAHALRSFIERKAREQWDLSQKPYSISSIAVDLSKEGHSYREAIGQSGLREWAISTEFESIRVLTDDFHKARVAFLPKNVNYEFESRKKPDSCIQNAREGASSPYKSPLIPFLKSLDKLTSDELDQIVIPTKILVKLLIGK